MYDQRALTTIAATTLMASLAGAAIDFGAPASVAAPMRPGSAAIADLNGDGHTDIAVTTDTPDKISIFYGDGSGQFGAPVNVPTGAGTGPDSILAYDVDTDGDTDLVVALKNINTVRLFKNTGGAFVAASSAAIGANGRGMAMADLDSDGDMDFAIANRDSNTVSVIRYQAGALVSASYPVGAEPRAVAIGDFNADGAPDLAASNHDARSLSVLRNNGTGTGFATVQTLPISNNRPEGIVAGDFDGDGDTDIAAASSDDNGPNFVALFRNTAGSFGGAQNFPTGGLDTGALTAHDLDLDGDLDLAAANETSNNVSILENLGGTFGPAVLRAVGTHPDSVVAGNLGGTSAPDLVVTNRDSNTISIVLNLAPGCPADFNGDGYVDGIDSDQFNNAFETGSMSADYNADGFVDGIDYDTFNNDFEAGC